jgi:hypothetical protein
MLLLMLACASEWEAELTPLELEAWAPTADAPGLPDAPLHLRFNAPLNSATLDNIAVYDAQGEWLVVDLEAEAGRPTLWVWPESSWTPDAAITRELSPGLAGRDGELLGGPVTVDFAILQPSGEDWE